MSDLSARDARALLDRLVADGPARLRSFVDAMRGGGGPANALDGSLASLDPAWAWFLELPAGVADEAPSRPPWWEPFHPQWARALGPERSVLATGLTEYFSACIVAQVPGATWAVGRSSSTRRHPVLRIPGRGEMGYAVPLGLAVRAVGGDLPADREPRALRRLAEIWLGLDEEHEAAVAALARPIEDWAVRAIDDPRFTHELSFDEGVAHRRMRLVARLIDSLRLEPGIAEVIHEDRDVALIRVEGLSAAEITKLVERMWADAGRSHEDGSPSVS